jgi:hypothetical protein
MPIYFYLHEQEWFQNEFMRAMAECRRLRSFEPCRALCQSMTSRAEDYWRRYHIGDDVPLVCQVGVGSHYDSRLWELVVGELIVVGAQAIPEFVQAPELLCCLAAGKRALDPLMREQFAPMQQAHLGARDLCLGATHYRPRHVGWNDGEDIKGLATFLSDIRPETWTKESLVRCGFDAEESAEELEYATLCLTELRKLYEQCAAAGSVIVTELMA